MKDEFPIDEVLELIRFALKLHFKFSSRGMYRLCTRRDDEMVAAFSDSVYTTNYITYEGYKSSIKVFWFSLEDKAEDIVGLVDDAMSRIPVHLRHKRTKYYILDIANVINDEVRDLLADKDRSVEVINDYGLVAHAKKFLEEDVKFASFSAYKQTLEDILDDIPYGDKATKSDHTKYEDVASLIFDLLLEDFQVPAGKRENRTGNGTRFVDIAYDVSRLEDKLLREYLAKYKANWLVIECKNSSEQKTINDGVDQLANYLSDSGYGNVGILLLRELKNTGGNHRDRLIGHHSNKKLILLLTDKVLKRLLNSSAHAGDSRPLKVLHWHLNDAALSYT